MTVKENAKAKKLAWKNYLYFMENRLLDGAQKSLDMIRQLEGKLEWEGFAIAWTIFLFLLLAGLAVMNVFK